MEQDEEEWRFKSNVSTTSSSTSSTPRDVVRKQVKEKFPHVILEASGGIVQDTMASFMGPHIDVISRGTLTQGYPCLDYSLKIIPN